MAVLTKTEPRRSTVTKTVPRRSAVAASRLRVVLMCDVVDGAQQRFLDAY